MFQKSKPLIRTMSYCCLLLIIAGTMVAQSTGGKRDSAATLIILGTLQDAGSPHIGCIKKCCNHLWDHPDPSRKVVSLGIYDPISNSRTLIDATPDISHQIKILSKLAPETKNDIPEHIIITHAHIGHYTGLMYLGREAMNTKNVPVSVMPGMYQFITNNGPWNQLVKLKNIDLKIIGHETAIPISSGLALTPFLVPHRAEYSETIGLLISGKNKKALFIPDIDKWHLWGKNIVEEIKKVDIAFLDATFYDNTEVNNRNIAEIPHPFVVESLELFKNLPEKEKSKIHFLHFNHTNPLLDPESTQTKDLLIKGFKIAKMGDTFKL